MARGSNRCGEKWADSRYVVELTGFVGLNMGCEGKRIKDDSWMLYLEKLGGRGQGDGVLLLLDNGPKSLPPGLSYNQPWYSRVSDRISKSSPPPPVPTIRYFKRLRMVFLLACPCTPSILCLWC